jgi:hypothetical protein
MERFINYQKLSLSLLKLNRNKRTLKKKDISTLKLEDIVCEPNHYINDITKLEFYRNKIYLDIDIEFFNKNINLQRNIMDYFGSNHINKINYFIYNGKIDRLIYGDIFKNKEFVSSFHTYNILENNRIYIQILTYCLYLLDNKYIIKQPYHELIYTIIVFYYVFIMCMPFFLGTASVAEIALYSLWDTYINIDGSCNLKINQNIMLDVEALSMGYREFYYNCINKPLDIKPNSPGQKYFPYLEFDLSKLAI